MRKLPKSITDMQWRVIAAIRAAHARGFDYTFKGSELVVAKGMTRIGLLYATHRIGIYGVTDLGLRLFLEENKKR